MTTAVVLGIARAVGETAPLLFTAFGADLMNANPFSGPQESLPLFVYRNIRKPEPQRHRPRVRRRARADDARARRCSCWPASSGATDRAAPQPAPQPAHARPPAKEIVLP